MERVSATSIWPVEQFEKDFEIISKISEGKYGQVFRARQKPNKMRILFGSNGNRKIVII